MNDLISVIIPCKNGVNYISEAIKSVEKQKMNTEIVVIDDGSTDETASLAQSLGAKVISIPASGLSAARNVGIKNAKGNYIIFLDHDDLLVDDCLASLSQPFESDSELQYVQAKMQDFISPELSDEDKKSLSPRTTPYGGVVPGTILFKKSALEIVGGFDEKLKTGQGVDFLLRCDKCGLKNKKVDFVSAMRRLHNNNMGRTMQKQEMNDYASLLRAKLHKK